jgi:hypothetical protein
MSKPKLPIDALTLAISGGFGSALSSYLWGDQPLARAIGIGVCTAVLIYYLYPHLWDSGDR